MMTYGKCGEFKNICARLCALTAFVLLGCAEARASDAYAWAQFTAQGLEARAITEKPACPKATIDGAEAAMLRRAEPDEAFPVLICALAVPKGAKEASIDGRPLALPPARIDKIALIGDTGCRLKAMILQGCNSLQSWPFRLTADDVAEIAPDLVLHVGDLVYRERACPPQNKACAGSPFGDNWETWKAELFEPAAALLAAAPLVFVRGNHEICGRAGRGWSRFMSAFPYDADAPCKPQEPPFFVDLGALSLAVLDVTRAEDRAVDDALAPLLKQQFAGLASVDGPLWIAMHKPVYAFARVKDGVIEGDNKTLVEAARGVMPANAQALISGHMHTFQAMSYAEDFPAQIVAGNGGDVLDAFAPQQLEGLSIGGVKIDKGRGLTSVFGFSLLERSEGEWLLTAYDAHEKPLLRCHLRGRKVACD